MDREVNLSGVSPRLPPNLAQQNRNGHELSCTRCEVRGQIDKERGRSDPSSFEDEPTA